MKLIMPLPWITTFNMPEIMLVMQPPWLPKEDYNVNTASSYLKIILNVRKKLPDTQVKNLRQYF